MRQQVNVNVDMIFDVDATLTREEILRLVLKDIEFLINPHDMTLADVELVEANITNLLEEAEIYGN